MEDVAKDDELLEVLFGFPVVQWFASSHPIEDSLFIPSLLIKLTCKSSPSSGKDSVDMVEFCVTFTRMSECCDIVCCQKLQAYDMNRMLFQA